MLPATCDERTSTIGVWALTVMASSTPASFIATGGTVALEPTRSSMLAISAVANPGISIRIVYWPGPGSPDDSGLPPTRRRPTGGRCPPRSRSRWHPAARHAARRRPRPEPSRSAARRDTCDINSASTSRQPRWRGIGFPPSRTERRRRRRRQSTLPVGGAASRRGHASLCGFVQQARGHRRAVRRRRDCFAGDSADAALVRRVHAIEPARAEGTHVVGAP